MSDAKSMYVTPPEPNWYKPPSKDAAWGRPTHDLGATQPAGTVSMFSTNVVVQGDVPAKPISAEVACSDSLASVKVNGLVVDSVAIRAVNCATVTVIDLPSSHFHQGDNAVEFSVANTSGGKTGFYLKWLK